MDLEASEPRCRCCCRCRGRPDNDKKTTTTATKKTTTTATNRFLVSRCADVFALPLYLACLFYLACWLSPAGIHLPPADFRLLASCSLWLACLFSLACWLSPAGIHLPPADFRLLASCSRLLAVACCLLQASTIAIARIQHIGGRNAGPPGVAALRRRSRDPRPSPRSPSRQAL